MTHAFAGERFQQQTKSVPKGQIKAEFILQQEELKLGGKVFCFANMESEIRNVKRKKEKFA